MTAVTRSYNDFDPAAGFDRAAGVILSNPSTVRKPSKTMHSSRGPSLARPTVISKDSRLSSISLDASANDCFREDPSDFDMFRTNLGAHYRNPKRRSGGSGSNGHSTHSNRSNNPWLTMNSMISEQQYSPQNNIAACALVEKGEPKTFVQEFVEDRVSTFTNNVNYAQRHAEEFSQNLAEEVQENKVTTFFQERFNTWSKNMEIISTDWFGKDDQSQQ